MKVKEAHKFLSQLINDDLGDLEMFTEFERVERMVTEFASTSCDGSSSELDLDEPYVYVQLGH